MSCGYVQNRFNIDDFVLDLNKLFDVFLHFMNYVSFEQHEATESSSIAISWHENVPVRLEKWN